MVPPCASINVFIVRQAPSPQPAGDITLSAVQMRQKFLPIGVGFNANPVSINAYLILSGADSEFRCYAAYFPG